jgi:23S rRNA (cytidine1920-2'-O)/16S rRNA (cytidine1409-2'-O)-methyltransferase
VRDAGARREALASVAQAADSLGLSVRGFASSGLPGPKGNRETFVWCSRGEEPLEDIEAAIGEVEP